MKLLLLLALVGLAASASLRPLSEISSSRQTLVYQYDTQVATGIEEVSNQFSTLRIRCQVLVQPLEDSTLPAGVQRRRIQFKECNVRQRNNATDAVPKNLLPMEQFRDLESETLWTTMNDVLRKSFSFAISQRQQTIHEMHFNSEDPFWSVNIKKGFLSLMQLNFLPKESDSAEAMAKGQWTKEINEDTVAAVCKTQYSAERLQFHASDSQLFKVSKAIDFNSCINPLDGRSGLAGVWFGLHHSEPLLQQQQQQQMSQLQTSNQGEFLVQRDPSNSKLIVQKASTKTIYTLQPFTNSWRGTEKTIAIQKLELKGVTDEVPQNTDSLQWRAEGLRLIFPAEAGNDGTLGMKEAMKEGVIRLFEQLLDDSNDVKMTKYEEILRIIRFHLFDESSLRAIAERLTASAKKQQLLNIFIVDMCPQIGSHGSVQFLMKVTKQLAKLEEKQQYVRDAQLDISHIGAIFAKLSMQSKVQMQSLQLILQTIRSEEFKRKLATPERMPIFSACWLSLGAKVNVYYSRQGGVEPYLMAEKYDSSFSVQPDYIRQLHKQPWEVRRQHARQSEEFRNQFVQEVREAIQKEGVRRTLALKVAKNCGLFELYGAVRRVFSQKTRNVNDRVQAVYATQKMLRRHTLPRTVSEDPRDILEQQKFVRDHQEFIRHFDQISRQIQADLLACFKNPREDPEVRIACYRVLMQSPIKQPVLNSLMQAIMSDPTQQVHSYCAQHMAQIATRPLPRYRRVARTVSAVVSTIQTRQQLADSYSRVLHAQLWDKLHAMGLTFETDMIVADKSFAPRWTHIRIDHQAMGRNLPLLEIGVRSQGLQQVLEKLMGPRGLIYQEPTITKLLRRVARSVGSMNNLMRLATDDQLLNIVPRILKDLPDMELTVAFMGYDVVFVKNSRQFSDAISNMNIASIASSLQQVARIFKPFVQYSTASASFQMPTTVGTMMEMSCMISINSQPSIEAQRQEMTDTKSKMQLIVEMPMKLQVLRKMGSNMHLLQHFQNFVTKVQTNKDVQYRMNFEIQRQEGGEWKLQLLQWRPMTQQKLVEMKNKQFCTVVEAQIPRGSDSSAVTFATVLKETLQPKMIVRPKTLNYQPAINEILERLFGIRLRINAQFFSNEDLLQAPCAVLMGPATFEIVAGPSSTTGSVIRQQVEISYPIERLAMPQVELKVDQVSQEAPETSVGQLMKLQFIPSAADDRSYSFDIRMQQSSSDSELSFRTELQLPEDLRMTPTSLPIVASEWIAERQLVARAEVRKDSEVIGELTVALKTNPQLKQLLTGSAISQQQMVGMFPLMAKCLNESRLKIGDQPKMDRSLFTPSCVRQFKKFNELNAMEVKFRWTSEEAPIGECRICQAIQWKLQQAMFPYLKERTLKRARESPKEVEVQICPSPLDNRMLNINASCPWMQWQWRSVQLPAGAFAWNGVDPVLTSLADYAKGGAAKCKLMNSHVRTFDNVIYRMQNEELYSIGYCPVLLARDCSPKKEFQVLMKFNNDLTKNIIIHLKLAESRALKIRISRFSSMDSSINPIDMEQPIKIYVNDRIISHAAPTGLQEVEVRNLVNPRQGLDVQITAYKYAGEVMYKIRSPRQQLEFLVGDLSLRTVEIRASPFYNNKMCGLCGDYNSEKYREFKGPNKEVSSAKHMIQQYIFPTSEHCRFSDEATMPEDWESFGTYDLIQKPRWSSFDLPARRPSCVIADGQRAKTFRNAEIDILTPATAPMFRQTPCALKLAVANINDEKVYVFMKQQKVIVQVGDFKQEISTHAPADSPRSSDGLPSGLSLQLLPIAGGIRCDIHKDEQRLTVKVTTDKRVVIKTKNLDSEDSICKASRREQLQVRNDNVASFLQKFTDSDSSCNAALTAKVSECSIANKHVTPFHKMHRQWRQPVKFLNDQLIRKLAESEAPILLSAAKLNLQPRRQELVTVQLKLKKQGGETVQQITVKYNQQTQMQVIKSSSGVQLKYLKSGSLQQASSLEDGNIDIDNDFAITLSSGTVKLSSKVALYEVNVRPQPEIIEATVVRAASHDSYKATGLCQISENSDIMDFGFSPRNVLLQVARNCVAENSRAHPIFTNEEVHKLNRFIEAESSDF